MVHKARPDADQHFEFQDEATPQAKRMPAPTKGRKANTGLYKDHGFGSSGDDEQTGLKGDNTRGQNDVSTHIRNESRKKDFAPHFDMADDSPTGGKDGSQKSAVPEIKKKAIQTNWKLYDEAPGTRAGINVAGNGMGGRKGTEFSLYGDDDEEALKKDRQGIKSMGNGMGGRKGTGQGFDWDF